MMMTFELLTMRAQEIQLQAKEIQARAQARKLEEMISFFELQAEDIDDASATMQEDIDDASDRIAIGRATHTIMLTIEALTDRLEFAIRKQDGIATRAHLARANGSL